MTKEEKIKQTYLELIGEEKYNFIKGQINEKGACQIEDKYNSLITPNTTLMDLGFKRDDKRVTYWLDSAGGYFIPISLIGIEENNGWIKIESEDDLPDNIEGLWEVVMNGEQKFIEPLKDNKTRLYKDFVKDGITHYQPIKKLLPPLY